MVPREEGRASDSGPEMSILSGMKIFLAVRNALALCMLGFGLASALGAPGEGWTDLFDGKSLDGWASLDGRAPSGKWKVEDGVLHLTASGGADLYTTKEYRDFILEFEWKTTPGGNSGVKYRMAWYGKEYLGPEYQILDDPKGAAPREGHGDAPTASLYAIDWGDWSVDPRRPAPQWNRSRIVARGTRLEHWLNGRRMVEADTSSEKFLKGVAASKFARLGKFGQSPAGRIMLQDHGAEVWFRSIRLRELDSRKL
jgi:3-keto-disaccharide hydrolase